MAGRFTVETVFKMNDRTSRPVAAMSRRIAKATASMERGFKRVNRAVISLNSGIKSAGRSAAVAGGIFVALSANVLGAGADFEQAITDVGAVGLQTRAQIEPLEKLALKLGRTTKFTSTQAANAMEVMARAGFKLNEILDGTPAVLSAAAASGLEIAEVANVVSNVLKGMGLATSEAARVADVLALASARTNSSIGSLGESMKNVASTASFLKIPLEDVVAGVALLQDVGLDASVAGSAFNTMLTKMAAPSKTITTVMKRLGISFKDAKGDMKPLGTVVGDISKASKAMGGTFDQVAFLAELVGLRGAKAAGNLAKLFESGKLKTLTAELLKAKGVADEMAALRMNTFQGSLLLLGSAVDAVKVKIFGMNSGPLKDVVDLMTKWVGVNEDLIADKLGSFLAKIIANLEEIVLTARQITGVVLAMWAFSFAVKALTAAFIVINAVVKTFMFFAKALPAILGAMRIAMLLLNIAMFANPVGLMVLGITALIGLAAAVIAAWGPVTKFFSDMFDKVNEFVSPVLSFFGFGGDEGGEDAQAVAAAGVTSPQARVASNLVESRSEGTATLNINGASEGSFLSNPVPIPGFNIRLTNSGAP